MGMREQFLARAADLKARWMISCHAERLVHWKNEKEHSAMLTLFRAEVYLSDREEYERSIKAGGRLQVSSEGAIRWSFCQLVGR